MSSDINKNASKIAAITTEIKHLSEITTRMVDKLDRWHEIYATKQELRLSLDDMRQELYKDLGYRRSEVNNKIDEQKKTINELREVIQPLTGYTEKRRRDQVIFYVIVFILSLLGSAIDPDMLQYLYKLF